MSERSATGQTITGRAICPEDDPFLFSLYQDSRAEEMAAWGWDRFQREQFLRLQFTAQQRHYRTAYPAREERLVLLDGTAVGRVCVARGEREIRLVDITLLERVRGRGIGGGLISALRDEAAAAGKPLRLSVLLANPASRLYQRLGFVPCGGDGVYLNMEWRAMADAPRARAPEELNMRSSR